MTRHTYPWEALRGDYIRGALGTAVGAGGAVAAGWGVVGWGFAGLGALFVFFIARTAIRQQTSYQLTEQGPPPLWIERIVRRVERRSFGGTI